ncbi:MAG: hypothetical protein OXC62_00430 [Aestuariivita sp.]|nr:hypothetical protein [Aestuariivita sp.]
MLNDCTGRFIAMEAIENLIESTAARWIILSYGSGGRGSAEDINQVCPKMEKLSMLLRWIINAV